MLNLVRILGRRSLFATARADSRLLHSPLLDDRALAHIAARVAQHRHSAAARRPTRFRHAGDCPSARLGQGLDYEEARPYQPGDDMRSMDWRSTARTGRPYLKVYREAHEPALHLVIDRGPSMRFGTRTRLKVTQAVRLAAALAFDAGHTHASVGATLWEPDGAVMPAGTGIDFCLRLLRAAAAPCPPSAGPFRAPQWTPARLARRLSVAVPRDARVVMISDFRTLNEQDRPVLSELAARYQLHAVQVLDSVELDLPAIGPVRFRDCATGTAAEMDTADPDLRARYRHWSRHRHAQQREWLASAGVRVHECSTETDPCALVPGISGS